MTVTVRKRTNRLGFVLPGFLAAGTVLLFCLAPDVPQDPVTQSDVAALTSIHNCDGFGVPAGAPHWSATVVDGDPDSPDDDDDDSPDRDGPDAIIASSSSTDIGIESTAIHQTEIVAVDVAEFDVHGLRGPPARFAGNQCHGQWPADGHRWSAAFGTDDSPDSSDDDDDDDDGPDALTAASPCCTDSAHHCSSDLSHASNDPIQHASENHSLRAPPQ